MALVTDYTTLQAHVLATLNRPDLASVVPNFIQQFEGQARRGIRISDGTVVPLRKLADRGTFVVSADEAELPTDYSSIESWYHDGPTYFGPIVEVPAAELPGLKVRYGETGPPQFAAIAEGKAHFAPDPNGTAYDTRFFYWRKVVALSTGNPSNWLLADEPDIYLYGTLLESAPYLKHDTRILTWRQELIERVEAFNMASQVSLFGGTLQRNYEPIGG